MAVGLKTDKSYFQTDRQKSSGLKRCLFLIFWFVFYQEKMNKKDNNKCIQTNNAQAITAAQSALKRRFSGETLANIK